MHDADVDLGLASLPTTIRQNFFIAGFSSHNANCTCTKHGFSTQLDLDLVYIKSLLAFFVVLSIIMYKSEFLGLIKKNIGTSVYLALIVLSFCVRSLWQYNAKDVNT